MRSTLQGCSVWSTLLNTAYLTAGLFCVVYFAEYCLLPTWTAYLTGVVLCGLLCWILNTAYLTAYLTAGLFCVVYFAEHCLPYCRVVLCGLLCWTLPTLLQGCSVWSTLLPTLLQGCSVCLCWTLPTLLQGCSVWSTLLNTAYLTAGLFCGVYFAEHWLPKCNFIKM